MLWMGHFRRLKNENDTETDLQISYENFCQS